jgi:membrane fusion protein, multidrug efflux system
MAWPDKLAPPLNNRVVSSAGEKNVNFREDVAMRHRHIELVFGLLGAILTGATVVGAPTAWAQPAPVPVQVAEVQSADVPFVLEGIGTVQAFNTITVRAQVDGTLQKIQFTEGQPVRAGEVLAQIDSRTYQAALDQASAQKAQHAAQLHNAQLDLQRYTELRGFASRQQLETQQATVDQLQAQMRGDDAAIESARTLLSYTTIASPMDGITDIRLVDQGNLVRAAEATGIVVVTQIQPISVIFTLPAESLAEIRQAMAAGPLQVTVTERQSARALGKGTLLLVNNQIDQASGQLRLKATLPNPDGALWPGQFVNVQLLVSVDRGVATVPSTAIQRGPDGTWVYLVKADQTVAVQPVRVRRFGGGIAVLEEGVSPRTTVVSAGHYRLTPGAHIMIVQATAAAPPA